MIAPPLTFALYPRARFYKCGIESWDGEKLVLSGTSSVLAGGPVEGDVLAIPAPKRGAVEQILTAKIARSEAG